MYLALISDIPVLSIKYQKDTGPYLFGYTPVSKLKSQVLRLCVTQSTPTLADTLPRSQAWVPPSGRPRAAGWAESILQGSTPYARLLKRSLSFRSSQHLLRSSYSRCGDPFSTLASTTDALVALQSHRKALETVSVTMSL